MIVLVSCGAVAAFVTLVVLLGAPPLPIGVMPMRIMKQNAEEVEKRKRAEHRAREREIQQAQREYDEAYQKAEVSYQKLKDMLERERFKAEYRNSVPPQANRRLRHLMID